MDKVNIQDPSVFQIVTEHFYSYIDKLLDNPEPVKENLLLKKNHTERVVHNSEQLAGSLGLQAAEIRAASVAGLYHDIGRFEQFIRYRTFSDSRSVDHAALGVQLIQENSFFAPLGSETRAALLQVITMHNWLHLPSDASAAVTLYAQILRDADKLDILGVVTGHYDNQDEHSSKSIELDLPNTPGYTQAVLHSLKNSRLVNIADVQNLNDFKLLQLSWVFDLNFERTLDTILELGYIDRILSHLPANQDTGRAAAWISDYIDRIKNTVFIRVSPAPS